ncbi:MAG: hypothetical protein ACRD1G_19200 [Acidimicrobiales bacterium]
MNAGRILALGGEPCITDVITDVVTAALGFEGLGCDEASTGPEAPSAARDRGRSSWPAWPATSAKATVATGPDRSSTFQVIVPERAGKEVRDAGLR